MSDWTYEMLRYAFSWNEESADKALKYVVSSRNSNENMSESQLLDILLLTILTEKDEVEKTSALVFLEEHGASLVFDYARLHKVYFVLDNILGVAVDGQSMTYSLKAQVLVTYTALLIQFNCFEADRTRFEGFVDLLYCLVKRTNKPADRVLRAYACECLHELESWYPGLLFPLLGDDWSVPAIFSNSISTTSGGPENSVGQHTLGKFVNDELLHIHESYTRLFFLTFRHFTEQVVREALKCQSSQDGQTNANELLAAVAPVTGTPPGSRASTPPATPRGGGSEAPGPSSSTSSAAANSSGDTFQFRVPEHCHSEPEVAFDLSPGQTPPRLPRKLMRTMTRSVSLVLESMPTSSSWTKIFIGERLSLFIRVLALPYRVVFHHFSPLLHASRPSLLHAFLVVIALFSREIDRGVSEAVVDRLFALTQDPSVEPFFRLLAINWLIALSSAKPTTFDLLHARAQELCPRWHDPLELKECKLQALLFCFKTSKQIPKNLLSVLEALSEFKYCCRPVGSHAVVFRFLLRILSDFAPEMEELGVPECLCDHLRCHPRLLPSVLAVERRANSKAVQYKLLHSLGDFVSRLEPPSRVQCYFGLLVTLSETTWLDPSYVMTALRRLVFCPSSSLSWQVGMKVLITCRRVLLNHQQAVIYKPMVRLLHHLASYQPCIDLRDRAALYLRLLTHAGSTPLASLFHPNAGEITQLAQQLTPVLPKTYRLVHGPVPFLHFFKSLDERRKLGILDKQCAVFVLPETSNKIGEEENSGQKAASDAEMVPQSVMARGREHQNNFDHDDYNDIKNNNWQRRWGDFADDHRFPEEWLSLDLNQRSDDVDGDAEGEDDDDDHDDDEGPSNAAAAFGSGGYRAGADDPSLSSGSPSSSSSSSSSRPAGRGRRCGNAIAGPISMSGSRRQSFLRMLDSYHELLRQKPASIRLPFVLKQETVHASSAESSDWSDGPKQLFSLELTFSASEHFVPIEPIRIPFISEVVSSAGDGARHSGGFPGMNKLLLKVQPISPVPTSFGVKIAFNDSAGHMFFGQLETFHVAFQDLFLPVRLPQDWWSHLFECIWMGAIRQPCWSVKVLDLERKAVHELVRSQLGAFIVPCQVQLPEEDFDFEQEEYFDRWRASSSYEDEASPHMGDEDDDRFKVELLVETICTIIFIPPGYHLLMRFTISSHSTIVRILTDRFQLLSYMDAFFLAWRRTATAAEEEAQNSLTQSS